MIILIQNLGVDTVELFSRKQSKKLPCLVQRIFHGTVFIHSLADEFMLEFITEYQVLNSSMNSSAREWMKTVPWKIR